MNTKLTTSGSQTLPPAWESSLTSHGALKHPPLIAGDRLLCVTSSKIFALDIFTGEEITAENGFPYFLQPSFDPTPPLTHSRGMVYLVDAGELIARQLSDGHAQTRKVDGKSETRWKAPRVKRVVSVSASDDAVVVCEAERQTKVSGFDPLTGEPLWKPVVVTQSSPGPVAATRDALVFVSGGHLFAVNIRSGNTRFEFTPSVASDLLSHMIAPQIGEVGDKSIVVVAGQATYAVDLTNGKQLWTYSATTPTANTQWFTPAISERYNRIVIANNNNELFVLELTTGTLQWSAEVPNLAQVRIVGDQVYAGGLGSNANLQVFELLTKPAKKLYEVNFDDVGRFGFIIGRGILFAPGALKMSAVPFGDQNAALFSGRASRITIDAQDSLFDFRQNDFTIETWINTTCGGEIISGFPTATGNQHHGFRINVSDQGRVRFAIINKDASSSFAASSAMTNVADGSWHHVAIVRRSEKVETYVDGVSVEVDTDLRGPGTLDISGNNALNLGAFVPGKIPQAYFKGLMRELRLWDIALDASKLESRMQRELIGTEPHLLGYWRMDEVDLSKLKNHVPGRLYTARPQKVRSFVTELALDTSVYPYLLDQVKLQWPYAGHWSARGAAEISTPPALERNGVLAFGAGNALYGVYSSDGSRAWSRSTPAGASAPVAGRGSFYALSATEGLISINSVTGEKTRVEGFDGFMDAPFSAGTRLPAPAVDGRYIAAALPSGKVWILENQKVPGERPKAWEWKANAPIKGDLSLVDGRVYLVAGETLCQLNPANKTVNTAKVGGLHALTNGDSVFCLSSPGTVTALAALDLKKVKATFALTGGEAVIGLAASSDLDLVVVATDKGKLHGLGFATLANRWSIEIPTAAGSSQKSLNSPFIKDHTVFCTSTSGSVAAVDARTGDIRGLFFEPTSISTPPIVDAGTIYFGCDDAPPEAKLLDGALHSVVFGQTHVLRLGLDHTGKKEQQPGYASITKGDLLEMLGVDSCCVEAWVNTQEGGEVLSIAPTAVSKYGLRLWLENDGRINFNCVDSHDDEATVWHRVTSSANSKVCDGKWHHVAVSRIGSEDVVIYLDSVALPTTTKLESITKPTLATGLKAFIGADAIAGAPGNYFAGMIGEIRVWDTYLTATRIADRMHDKLVGNEPDLLAYWNFDRLGINDTSRNGHDGVLETGGGSSGYWLTDLNFTHPSYPSLETEGRILQEGSSGTPETIYQLTIIARKADGTPLADHELTLWYVRHKGETGPDTIQISSGAGAAELKAVKPDHSAGDSYTTKTGSNGKAVIKITTKQQGHGPSLDVRPAFVPANERYHVNTLLDTQKLEKPAPPKLEAQAKLSQDYYWETGDNVDHSRDRATWRAVITARNSDGRPRGGERLQLWATEHVEVEVNGRRYPINPNNYQSFVADHNGELTVTLAADELRAPALSVWAGFMHRDERYTIPLDEEAHDKLGKVTGDELNEKRMTSWKPDYKPAEDGQAIIKDAGYKEHAGKVATAIQHVMSVREEPKEGLRTGLVRTKRARLRADLRNFGDMRQAPPPERADSVTTLRTLKHVDRQLPLEPENFKFSLGQTAGLENSIGFIFTKGDIALRPITSVAQVEKEFLQKKAPAAPPLLGNIFEDAWNAIESAAEAAWREAKRIAIYIADTVMLVVEYADKVVQKVVATVKEAIDAVVHIIKMIGAFIADVIRFLMTLFDWGAILDAHRLIKQICNQQFKEARRLLAGEQGALLKMITGGVETPPTAQIDTSNPKIAGQTASTVRANNSQKATEGHINSVQGKYVNNKVDERKDEMAFQPATALVARPIGQGDAIAADLLSKLGGALTDPLSSFSDLYTSVQDLVAGDVRKTVTRLLEPALPDFKMLGELFDGIHAALNAPIEIPFISQLYKWITREQLTLLDVFCLAIAVPAHIGYAIYTKLTTGDAHKLSDDLRPWVEGQTKGLLTASEHNRAVHFFYLVFNTCYTIGSGVLRSMRLKDPEGAWKSYGKYYTVMVSFFGLGAKTLLYFLGKNEEEWDENELIWHSTLYGGLGLMDIYTAIDAFRPDSPPSRDSFDLFRAQLIEVGKVGCSIVGAALVFGRVTLWITGLSKQPDLFHVRGILQSTSLCFAFSDTKYVTESGAVAYYLILGETLVKVASGVVHFAAIQSDHTHS